MTRFPLSGKDGGKRERNTHNAVFPLRKSPKNGKILYFPPSFPYVGDNKNPLCLFFHCALRGCKVEEKGGGALAAGYFGIGGWSLVTLPSIGDLFPPPPINWETRGCKHAFLIWLGGTLKESPPLPPPPPPRMTVCPNLCLCRLLSVPLLRIPASLPPPTLPLPPYSLAICPNIFMMFSPKRRGRKEKRERKLNTEPIVRGKAGKRGH